jgi:hypothetical protein
MDFYDGFKKDMKVGDLCRHKGNHKISGIIVEIKNPDLDLTDPFVSAMKDMLQDKKVWILTFKYSEIHPSGKLECLLESQVEVINENR